MNSACQNCSGHGVRPRWKAAQGQPPVDGICLDCGGSGLNPAPLKGWLAGTGLWPDISAPCNGRRLALVFRHDGTHERRAGKFWRLALALRQPKVSAGRSHGSTKRDVKDTQGNARNLPVLRSGLMISGVPLAGEGFDLPALQDTPGPLNCAIQLTNQFPRTTYRGNWTLSQAEHRLVFTGCDYMLDKVH